MRFLSKGPIHRFQIVAQRSALAAALALLPSVAHATDYDEAVSGDLSSVGTSPTSIGSLTLGDNRLAGASIPSGPVVNPMTGERQFQDNDYASFTVTPGQVLSNIFVNAGTTISPGDRFFIGIASGFGVNVTLPSSAGLLGYTLVSSQMIGTNILDDLGLSAPPMFPNAMFAGATKFSGALPAGTYSLWILDGDRPITYQLNLQTAAVPEPASWLMMVAGFGALGLAVRRRRAGAVRFLA